MSDELAQVTQSLSCVACIDVAILLATVLVLFIFGGLTLLSVVGVNLTFTLLHLLHIVLIVAAFVALFGRYLYSRLFFLVAAGLVLAIDTFILMWRTLSFFSIIVNDPSLGEVLEPLIFFLLDIAFFTTALLYLTAAGRRSRNPVRL